MRRIQNSPTLKLQTVVTGMHLQQSQGFTATMIEDDGFAIDHRVYCNSNGDSSHATVAAMSRAMAGVSSALLDLKPDAVVLLGDRFEIFSAAAATYVHQIPIAHIHGGEVTGGAIDEGLRHSISKMAHVHFVSTEIYARRLLQLGEHPDQVHNVGALAVEAIQGTHLVDLGELQAEIGLNLEKFLLVTYHPETLNLEASLRGLDALLVGLDSLPDRTIVITQSNSDTGASVLNYRLEAYAKSQPRRVTFVTALGQQRYLSLLARCDAVIGNSSSSFVEAPVYGVPAVDIGDRQRGRMRPANIIHSDPFWEGVVRAISTAVTQDFRSRARRAAHPFGDGSTSLRMLEILERTDFSQLKAKDFVDH